MNDNPFSTVAMIDEFLDIWLNEELLSKDMQKRLRDYYRNWRSLKSARLRYWYTKQLMEVQALIAQTDRPRVLEIGSGKGTEALWLAWQGANITGIEFQDTNFSIAEARLQILNSYRTQELDCRFKNCSIVDFQDKQGFDVIWLEQAFHHLEPREVVTEKIADLLKPGGHVVFQESNALNPFIQALLFRHRGFKTIKYSIRNGKMHPFGNERILSARSLARSMAKVGVDKKSVRYFRCFPANRFFDRLFGIEKFMVALQASGIIAPIFTHYNLVAQRRH